MVHTSQTQVNNPNNITSEMPQVSAIPNAAKPKDGPSFGGRAGAVGTYVPKGNA
jgi:hypothetical protein